MKTAYHEGLYDPSSERPQLIGSRCAACQSTFFPPLGVGCEKCGADGDQLRETPIGAVGVLHSVATVHLHAGKDMEAPFTVGEIQLDDGPLIRAVMKDQVAVDQIGARVSAEWVVANTGEEGGDIVEPRFVLDGSQ
jgi:hypothetical protein